MKAVSAVRIAKRFVNNWVIYYDQPANYIEATGSSSLRSSSLTLAEYKPFQILHKGLMPSKVEIFNRAILADLRAHINGHRRDSDLKNSALTFVNNT